MLEDLRQPLWDLTGENVERSAELYAEIRERARQDLFTLSTWIQGIDLTDADSSLFYSDIIEALSQGSPEFDDFLLVEIERVRAECEKSPGRWTRFALGAFEFLEDSDESVREALKESHLRGIRSETLEVRLAAISALHGWTIRASDDVRDALVERLDDRSWRVRKNAEWLLRDEDLLPQGYRVRWRDRLVRFAHGLSKHDLFLEIAVSAAVAIVVVILAIAIRWAIP